MHGNSANMICRLPDIALPEETETLSIGIYGERHSRYLKINRKAVYVELLTSGRLHSYLADINEQVQERVDLLVRQMAETEGVSEKTKAENQMERVGKMNNIKAQAKEIISKEIIYC